ncbi:MAG: hypothetical protein JWM71_2546 [Solirubrobacteraceae bacterium]|nr:hypothetical protein [Solirubrobacteraceae bacterium]
MHTSSSTRIADSAAHSDPAMELSRLAQSPSVTGALASVRGLLGMDVAYTSEIVGEHRTVRALDGDGASFLISEGSSVPSDQTYCHRIAMGRLPNVVVDVRADDRAASLPMTEIADVGAFVSVPLRLSDGRIYGTLCAASHEAKPELGYRDLQFLHVAARIVADQIELHPPVVALVPDAALPDLLRLATALRTDALDLLETACDQTTPSGAGTMLIDHLQHVGNDLGSVERLLIAAA